jgi:predicted O-methyltransferase YrrM
MKFLEQMLFRRPRLLNLFHSVRLVQATSQTIETELRLLEHYAKDAHVALEIGSYQGVSARRIAEAMADGGILYCVDPWPSTNGKMNSCYSIFRRNIRRVGLSDRIRTIKAFSSEAAESIPQDLDFIFVDGDHSWTGIETDWLLVGQKLRVGGIVCLHDSHVPPGEPWRDLDSVRFYSEIIRSDPRFEVVDSVHSVAVLRRVSLAAAGQSSLT